MARNADTGVSRSAEIDLATGTSVASRANRENSLKSGRIMIPRSSIIGKHRIARAIARIA
jgi:hypothetical protein